MSDHRIASYNMDSHLCQRVVVEESGKTTVRNEGGIGQKCAGPYPVSYRAIVPKKAECENLLVPVCLSVLHIAYGSNCIWTPSKPSTRSRCVSREIGI